MGVRYIIGGSIASSFHGNSRSTCDSDLIADIHVEHVPLLFQQLKDDFYISLGAAFDAVQHYLNHMASELNVQDLLEKTLLDYA